MHIFNNKSKSNVMQCPTWQCYFESTKGLTKCQRVKRHLWHYRFCLLNRKETWPKWVVYDSTADFACVRIFCSILHTCLVQFPTIFNGHVHNTHHGKFERKQNPLYRTDACMCVYVRACVRSCVRAYMCMGHILWW